MLISMLKYIKKFKGTSKCFDLNRSSSGGDDLLRSKHVGVPLNIFMYFNIEINILD